MEKFGAQIVAFWLFLQNFCIDAVVCDKMAKKWPQAFGSELT